MKVVWLLVAPAVCLQSIAPRSSLRRARPGFAPVFRITNSASTEAAERSAAAELQKPTKIKAAEPDLGSPSDTFEALCVMCGVPPDREASLDFQGFALAFEQLFNRNVPLTPEALDELKAAVDSGNDEDVSMANWNFFHKQWTASASMAGHLDGRVAKKRARADLDAEKKRLEDVAKKREDDFQQRLVKATQENLEKARSQPTLLAKDAQAKQAAKSKWFEARESAAKAAAQYRSLDPAKWADVVADVGGLDAALEEIRRRVWTPLCAPAALLDELGAERLKGVLLYGPPGCGKSYLAARLAKGLSRRAVTVVSGPEIMDKYVGSSEAQLRELFTNPPKVEPRVGDAPDVHMVAEANELHVILLDEFDAIARQRSDGKTSDTSTRDSVVNQLLALMDGVSELPVPTFVLALTNRRELVDDAVLRPGRLEVHVEVPRPDERGRRSVLRIHAEKMRSSGRLRLGAAPPPPEEAGDAPQPEDACALDVVDDATYDAWVADVAARTDGFSGAAMASVVRAAVSRALDRSVKSEDVTACTVDGGDFDRAVDDVRRSTLELAWTVDDAPAVEDVAEVAVEDVVEVAVAPGPPRVARDPLGGDGRARLRGLQEGSGELDATLDMAKQIFARQRDGASGASVSWNSMDNYGPYDYRRALRDPDAYHRDAGTPGSNRPRARDDDDDDRPTDRLT